MTRWQEPAPGEREAADRSWQVVRSAYEERIPVAVVAHLPTNHRFHLASIDFFRVPMATFAWLFVFVVLAHDRRRIVHLNVTAHPTAALSYLLSPLANSPRAGQGCSRPAGWTPTGLRRDHSSSTHRWLASPLRASRRLIVALRATRAAARARRASGLVYPRTASAIVRRYGVRAFRALKSRN